MSLHRPRLASWKGAHGRAPAAFVLALALVGGAVTQPALAAGPVTTDAVVAAAGGLADDIRWTVTPADADGPDGRVSLRHIVEAGGSVTDAIAVTNSGAVDGEFEVTAGEGVVGGDGAFDIGENAAGGVGEWIRVDGLTDGRVAVGAGETRVLPVSIAVPADATPGDHPAGITVGVSQGGDGVTVRHRVGVRLHLQVAGELAPAIAVSDVSASFRSGDSPFAPGTVSVEYTVENTGNVRLGAAEHVAVAGPFGVGSGQTDRTDALELLPGASARQTREIAVLPWVLLLGTVTIAPVALGDDVLALPLASSADFATFAMPWGVLIALLLLVSLGFLALLVRRRARGRAQRRIDDAVAAARTTP